MSLAIRKATRLRIGHVLLGAFWMASLAAFGILQVHLRFAQRDMDIQARQIQENLRGMRDSRAALEVGVDRMRGGEELRARAVSELGLQAPPPVAVRRLSVPRELWEKYHGAPGRPFEPGVLRAPGRPFEPGVLRAPAFEDANEKAVPPAWMRLLNQGLSIAELQQKEAYSKRR